VAVVASTVTAADNEDDTGLIQEQPFIVTTGKFSDVVQDIEDRNMLTINSVSLQLSLVDTPEESNETGFIQEPFYV
jgi:hypothetical protein